MDSPKTNRSRLANLLSSLRSESGLSLAELAQISGVSRATLSRIENAEVSPTAETLSAICTGLRIPMARVIAMTEADFPALIPFEVQTEFEDDGPGVTTRAVSPASPQLSASVDEMHLPPNTEVTPAHHPDGAEMQLIVIDGALAVRLGETHYALTAGDCLRYRNYGPASFETPETRGARFLIVSVS